METRRQLTWVEDSLQGLFISFYHVSLRDLTQGFRFGGRCLNHWVIFLAQVFISFLSFKLHILKCCLSSAGNHQCLSSFNDSLFHAVSFIVFWDVPAILQKRRFKAVGVAQCWNVSLSCTWLLFNIQHCYEGGRGKCRFQKELVLFCYSLSIS